MPTNTDNEIAHSLRDFITQMKRKIRKQMNLSSPLSIAEQDVLYQVIALGTASPSELCERLKISSQFMSQVLNRLQNLDYISRQQSLTDKRKSLVSLTKAGRQMIDDSRKQREEWLAGIIATHYSTKDKETIRKALELLSIIPDL